MRAVLSGAIRKRIAPLLYVILSVSEKRFLVVIARHEVPRQSLGVKYGVYAAYFFRGIATLALAMTRKFNCHCEARSAAAIPQTKYVILSAAKYPTELSPYCHCEGVKRPRQSLGVKYGVYAAYFFRGIATLALAMTRKFNCHCEARSAAAIPQTKHVILSGSEISRRKSDA